MSRCFERIEDTGPVYVRENGKLCVVGSHKVGVRAHPVCLFSKSFSVELCVNQEEHCTHRREPFIFIYTKQGSLRYCAKSLFTLTLDLITDNIQHVDSLVGFPEQIAEKLFTAAEAKQKFYSSGPVALRKFTEAYSDLVLSSLCLRGRYLLVSERLEEIKLFQSLRCLDLSFCKLGDEHELIGHLPTLNSLAELYLKDNCLSDAGLRRMTAPLRVLQRGPASLTVLDVSFNQNITELGVTFLFVFKQLLFLDISETGIQDPIATAHKIQSRTGLLRTHIHLAQFSHVGCRTQGWAEQLVNHWESIVISAAKPKEDVRPRRAAQKFYGKEWRRHMQDPVPIASQSPEPQPSTLLQFLRPDTSLKPDRGLSSPKRAPETITPVPSMKRPRAALSAEDWDFLNNY